MKNWVSSCITCQQNKAERVPYLGLLQPLALPTQPWSDICRDFIEGLPVSHGFDVILVVVDRMTKYAHFIPLVHPFRAQTVAQKFFDNVFKLHGLPESIVIDRDRIFFSLF